jgi:hypothetical protein
MDVQNVTLNWFGVANEAEVAQRVFDLDDWNIYTIANFTPFYVSEEQFLEFWWGRSEQPKASYFFKKNRQKPASKPLIHAFAGPALLWHSR